MRISHKYKLLFFSNPKCGSSSIRMILDELLENNEDAYIKSRRKGKTEFFNHINAIEASELFSKYDWNWDNYLKIITIRNPFDKLVSIYFYNKPDKNNTPFYRPGYEKESAFQMDFKNWLKEFCHQGLGKIYQLKHFCFGLDGQSYVNHILRIEDIDQTLPSILDGIGLKIPVLPRLNTSEHKPYWEYYDTETRALVEKYFTFDIKIGNYYFENGK